MRNLPGYWLLLTWLPGCLLVQPLDSVKGDTNGAAGGSSAGSGSVAHAGAGSAGQPATGSGGSHSGGANAVPPGGSGPVASGGAPGTVDFALFTGTWTVDSGSTTTTCSGKTNTTAATPGGTDTVDLGTDSDLIFNADTQCPILADVTGQVATGQSGQACSFDDPSSGLSYDLYFTHFDFKVSAGGQTATATISSTVLVSNPTTGASQSCTSAETYNYSH